MLLISVTLCCLVSLAAPTCLSESAPGGINQHPRHILIQPGGTASISCIATENVKGVNLRNRFTKMLFVNSKSKAFVYNNNTRVNLYGNVNNFTVTIKNVTEEDTGFYLCDGIGPDNKDLCGKWTVLSVAVTAPCNNSSSASDSNKGENLHVILPVVILMYLPVLIFAVYKIYKRSQMKNRRQPLNSVYEDMTKTLRRNTMSSANGN
ncbi:uncharacterized protein LOC105945257 [Xenopus tropicalis]|uniref:Uncharacterized protein LOC105945257 n=1 Tax=Xenopus tropicalis TaxID=8364 RepID=A0A8J0SBU5_XENTR|nr:uncharacterized protein LOC105945257 [Xenopus tropicalis]